MMLLLIISGGIYTCVLAQAAVSGRVLDATTNEAIPGVHVQSASTSMGTITDTDGYFSLKDLPDSLLTISCIGYQQKSVVAENQKMTVILEPTLVELNPLIVSASRESQPRIDIPMAIAKLDEKELLKTKAASLDQVINKVSGVFMVNLGNEQHSMSIRQPLTLKSLFLYMEDGIPIRPTGVFNHNALIEINMASVKSIEVIKGPASSIYGSEAIGGSINFITQSASEFPTANLSIQADNLGYKRTDFGAGNTFGKLGLQLSGYYANRRDGYRAHSDFDKFALSLRSDVGLGKKDRLTTTASIIDYKADMAGSIDSANFYSKNYPSLHTFTDRRVKALRIRSSWSHFWNTSSKTTFSGFYRNNSIGQTPAYRVKNKPGNSLLASGEINENTFTSYGTLVQHLQELGFWEGRLIAGASLDYSPNSFFAEYIDITRNEEGKYTGFTKPDSLLTDYGVDMLNTAAYIQADLSPVENLRLVMALRYDHFYYDYHNFLTANAFSGAPDSKNSFQNLSPKLGFTYDFGRQRGVYGNYSIGFVPPQVSELYRGVKVPVLEPSVYRNYEVGGWFAFAENGYFDLSLYQLDGSNEIVNMLLDDGTRENRNAGKTRHQGIEYGIRYSPISSLIFRLSGSYAHHQYVEFVDQDKNYDGKQMEAAPAWINNAEIWYHPEFLKNARIGIEWQHLGEYYMDAANTEKYSGFDIINLRVGYEFKNFDTWCNIMNLTDVLYATNAGKSKYGKDYNPGDPRAFSLGIGYNLGK